MKWSIPERVIDQARKYVADKRVLSINSYFEKKVWVAEVMGDEIYRVELDGTTKEDDYCECSYWKEHGYCRHTVAVELELRDRGISRIMTEENAKEVAADSPNPGQELTESFTRVFLNEHRETLTPLQKNRILELEYKIETKPLSTALVRSKSEVFALSIRAGVDKLYIVKDLTSFFDSFSAQSVFEIKPGQTIDFKQIKLTDEDAAIMDFLQKQIHSNALIIGNQKEATLLTNNKRYLVLSPILAELTLQMLQDSGNLQFVNGKNKYKTVVFVENQLPISFELFQRNGVVILDTLNLIDSYLDEYQWFISGNVIFQPSKEQLRTVQPLRYFLQRYDGKDIEILPENMPDFTAYVMPLLTKMGEVTIDEALKNSFIQEPLKTIIYFRYEKEAVHATVEFNYKQLVLSTNPEENQLPDVGVQIIRDSQKEMSILNRLKEYNYHRTETSYTKRMVRDEDFYTLFTQEIPTLELEATIYVDDLLDSMFLDQIDPETSIDVQNDGSFLDIRFDIGGITSEEVDKVLKSLSEKKAFHKLDNGTLIDLETDNFKQISDVLSELRVLKNFQNGKISLPSYRGLELHEKFGLEEKNKQTLSRKFQDLIQDLNFPDQFEAVVPKGLHADLRPYQITGYKWLKMLSKYGFGGILADDMGLGKTIQVITYILSEIEEKGKNDPFLIVAPASLTYNWNHEFKKFAPSIENFVVAGTAEERMAIIDSVQPNQVLITSYPSFRQDADLYKKKTFSLLALDESQMVKNYHTKTAQALRGLSIKKRFALSGTPIENKIEELWAIFQLIMPGFFPSIKQFKTLPYEQIAKMIRPFVLRRIKKDVLKELPDKIETNLYSSMTKEQKTVYLAYLQRIQESVQNMSGEDFRKNRIEILSGLTRLRQICCDPRLFLEDYEGESGKLEQLKDLLATAKESGKRVLIFSQFTSMLTIIERELATEGVDTFYLSGQTKPKERLEMVNRFNDGEKEIFLISLKAGGTGLNLTGADTVILYDLWWNPAVEEQAAGRAHRLGQKKVVEVWRLIAEGTIEEKINALQQEKKALFDQVITAEAGDQKSLNQLTESDIREILSIGN
ncbi:MULTISPECIES: DEAD/DEAH box helicase [Carnobacterium]|uniref:SNF2 helicase associated domain-containing protein n=2 Tax=Carnobacterium TaxID=2747 RepID=A0ABW4NKS8_9LACT|nr:MULTISPECIES: DEAD/DEAH box helicase [unclassified Carnobacterium]ALV21143.1 Superfamily II DNA/RNA helicase, SNF2 [Carnobacterium sp. CP1]QQP71281.1 DEAD/DEAH box helicase [Carnobacterium sp. CS13]